VIVKSNERRQDIARLVTAQVFELTLNKSEDENVKELTFGDLCFD
jgi:hypothetical protein